MNIAVICLWTLFDAGSRALFFFSCSPLSFLEFLTFILSLSACSLLVYWHFEVLIFASHYQFVHLGYKYMVRTMSLFGLSLLNASSSPSISTCHLQENRLLTMCHPRSDINWSLIEFLIVSGFVHCWENIQFLTCLPPAFVSLSLLAEFAAVVLHMNPSHKHLTLTGAYSTSDSKTSLHVYHQLNLNSAGYLMLYLYIVYLSM